MSIVNGFAGVSNCYVFKSRLQEYVQKEGFLTPIYETLKEGPSHEPYFKSTVTVDNVRYDSLPGFFNRKAAEQSAAEVALLELAKSGKLSESASHPVHETGLCKNLLQEYAQKMSYAIPLYVCQAKETPGKKALYFCTVEIGGIQYIGAAARTKKEAELKAARTALLAIQSNSSGAEAKPNGNLQLTVLPGTRKVVESDTKKKESLKLLKPKKRSFKKKPLRAKYLREKIDQLTQNVATPFECTGKLEAKEDGGLGGEYGGLRLNQQEAASGTEINNNLPVGQTAALNSSPNDGGLSSTDIFSGAQISDLVNLESKEKHVAVIVQVAQTGAAECQCLNQHSNGQTVVENVQVLGVGDQVGSNANVFSGAWNNNLVKLEEKQDAGTVQVAHTGAAEGPGLIHHVNGVKVVENVLGNQGLSNRDVFSGVQVDDPVKLESEENRFGGIAETVTAEGSGITQNADEKMMLDYESVQRVIGGGEQVDVSNEFCIPIDLWSL